jgi:magnesium chelatase subunit I
MKRARTIAELKSSGYKIVPVKDEIRNNLIHKLQRNEKLFQEIIGYEKTVIPSIVNAILAKHDILLLGKQNHGWYEPSRHCWMNSSRS